MATYDQTEILWDKYKNVPDAYPGSSYLANQAVGDAFPQIVSNSQLWGYAIPATAPLDLGGEVSFTNGTYQISAEYTWIRKYNVTMGAIQAPGISYWYASTNPSNPLGTNVCRDTIPFNFDPFGSYNIQVKANGVLVSPTYTPYPWNYDESAGVLTFFPQSESVLPPTPITMIYWRYEGPKGGALIDTTLQTTGTRYLTMVPLSATSSGQVLGTATTLSYNVGTGTLTATMFSGNLTGSATLIDTTLTTTNAPYFVTFVQSSADAPNGQTLRTDAGLTYNPSTNSFVVVNGTITAPTFTGSLTGSASLIDTTLQSSGTRYLTMVPLSADTPTGQALGTTSTLSYNAGTDRLTNNGFIVSDSNSAGIGLGNRTSQTFDNGNGYTIYVDNNVLQFYSEITNAPVMTVATATEVLNVLGRIRCEDLITLIDARLPTTHSVYLQAFNNVFYCVKVISGSTTPLFNVTPTDFNVVGVTLNAPILEVGGGARQNNARTIASFLNYSENDWTNIQLGGNSTNYNSWLIGVHITGSSNQTELAFAPLGVGQYGCWYVDENGETFQNGNGYAKEFISYSCKHRKENIEDLHTNYCVDFINKLKPKKYKFKRGIHLNDKGEDRVPQSESDKIHFGFLAQDVEEDCCCGDKLAVHYKPEPDSNKNKTQGLAYQEIIAPLVKTVQDLLKRVAYLEEQLKNKSNE